MDGGIPAPTCQPGRSNTSLTPPPVECVPSFQTTSLLVPLSERSNCVPPHPSAKGLEAGKSACARPSPTPSSEPLSPDAQHTVMPSAAAAWSASLKARMNCWEYCDSAFPQLMEMTEGWCSASCTAVVMASRKPRSLLGAKYTTIDAPGAMEPTTSISSITSRSGPEGSPVGAFCPPSTEMLDTWGSVTPNCLK